jgi:Peptidase inhibitor I78 family
VKAIVPAFALIGCATIPSEPAASCNADRLSGLAGRPATAELAAEAQRLSGAARLRWIRPGDVVTMDFSAQRLNIHLDAQNRVDHFVCG